MTLVLPTFEQNLAAVIADMNSSVIVAYNGQIIPLDFSADSMLLAFARAVCLVGDSIAQLAETTDLALRWRTATGTDLNDMGALLDVTRLPGTAARVPVKFFRNTAAPSTVPIPALATVLAADATGAPTIAFMTVQDPALDPGLAGNIPSSGSGVWLFCIAVAVGLVGNVSAGKVVSLQGGGIAGVDGVANPAVADPLLAPTVVVVNTGGLITYQYMTVFHGQTGVTNPSPLGQTTGGNAVLDSTNKNTVSWVPSVDTTTTDVLKNTGTTMAPIWSLLGTVAAGTTSLDDTGQATTTYTLPTANTTNTGTGGTDLEGDESYRARIPQALTVAAKSTLDALIGAVEDVAGVQQVWAQDLTPAPGQVTLHVLPLTSPIGPTTSAEIAAAIADTKAAGISVSWSEQLRTATAITYVAKVDSTVVSPASLATPILAALGVYFAGLQLGAPVFASEIIAAITDVPGVACVTISSLSMSPAGGGGPYNSGADVPAVVNTLYSLGSVTSTLSY